MTPVRLGISSCLLGEKVRYDGGHRLDHYLRDVLGKFVTWVPVCPESECGLGIPREAMRLVGDPASQRLVTIHTGKDLTQRMARWIDKRLEELAKEDLSGFIFKKGSPSSGFSGVKIYTEQGFPRYRGMGLFARAFVERFSLLPAEDEARLNDAGLRENFITRVFAYRRWQDFEAQDGSRQGLVDFHTRHKLLLMSHSPGQLTALGRLVASLDRKNAGKVMAEYLVIFMGALKLEATVKKNTNVLTHMLGYFKKELSADEKSEVVEVIGRYHAGQVPLVVPLTLLNHYVRKYKEPYLSQQYYLNPHPAELMLRNHV